MREIKNSTTVDISVVICAYTRDRWYELLAAVESLRRQTVAACEVIVVIDHNRNLLHEVQEHILGVTVIENMQAKGLSGARNSGAAGAQGAVVAFLDDDAFADPTWIERLAECYSDPQVGGVGGKIVPLWTDVRPAWFPAEFNWVVGCTYRGMPTVPTPVRNMIGANMSVRRAIFHSVGGFRLAFGCDKGNTNTSWFHHHAGDEETEFCIRVAQVCTDTKLLYAPSAKVHHRVSAERMHMRYFLWRCYDEGLGKAALVKLHGSQKSLASERIYTTRTLPAGIALNLLATVFCGDLSALARLAAILLGFSATLVGYIVGNISLLVSTGRHTQELNQRTGYPVQEEC